MSSIFKELTSDSQELDELLSTLEDCANEATDDWRLDVLLIILLSSCSSLGAVIQNKFNNIFFTNDLKMIFIIFTHL